MQKISEVIFSPKRARNHPFEITFLGFFYTSISLFLSLWIFPEFSSLSMVFLSVIACLYMTQGMIIREESLEDGSKSEKWLLKEHSQVIKVFFLLFMGFVIAYTFWMIVLPTTTTEILFSLQKDTFEDIKSITGRSVALDNFNIVLTNNLRVLFLSIIFSVFYGAGSIFILAWNASLIGFVIGDTVKNVTGLLSIPQLFVKYFLHGIPEIVAYLTAALAGSLLFVTIAKGDLKEDRIKRTLLDVAIIISISVAILVLAAAIEAFISPMI